MPRNQTFHVPHSTFHVPLTGRVLERLALRRVEAEADEQVLLLHGDQVLAGPDALASLGLTDRSVINVVHRTVHGHFVTVERNLSFIQLWYASEELSESIWQEQGPRALAHAAPEGNL